MKAVSTLRLVLVTAGCEKIAVDIAQALVKKKLAACVNINASVRSIYRWKDSVIDDDEVLLIIKTSASNLKAVQKCIEEHHSYDVPEIISVPIDHGSEKYLKWWLDNLN